MLRDTRACTFFDSWTTSEGPKVARACGNFLTVLLKTCFAPQWRALFPHRNIQKWSGNGVFCTFLLPNVLRTAPACTFSTSQRPKVLRTFDFKMRFVPQGRALFQHLNFQKCSENDVSFDTFDFKMCFAPQRRELFHLSSGKLPPHPLL